MLALLTEMNTKLADEHQYLGDRRARVLRAKLAALPEDATGREKYQVLMPLAVAELTLGREREAIEDFRACYELLPKLKGLLPSTSNQITFWLGMSYMRYGETQNCCMRNSPESCLLPIQGRGVHTDQEGSRQAIKYFTKVLGRTAPRTRMHLRAQWLLNIAYMTLGAYPDEVPEEHLIPPSAFASEAPFPRFTNISQRLGLNTFSTSGGAIADDFDNDGYLDLAASPWNPAAPIRLFHNNRDGTFSERTRESGLTGFPGGLNLMQADYNNDGNVDILALRGAWNYIGVFAHHPNSLFRNNGDGTFTDVTFDAGLGEHHYSTQTASWADYDNDGDLDLYVGNESVPSREKSGAASRGYIFPSGKRKTPIPCQLFRNNGNGTFTDVARKAGVTNGRFTKAVVWGDYDNDRLPDIFVSNFLGLNRLYHNNGDGTFTDVAPNLGITLPRASFPAWFWDFNNDGNLDIYVSAYAGGVAHVAMDYLGLKANIERAHLYQGDGEGGFFDVARQMNVARPACPMGSNFGDLDNDGYLDFYLGTGWVSYDQLMPNIMYLNQHGERFANVTTAGGFGNLQKGHAIVFADFDHDGDQDVFEQMGGALLGDKFYDAFYENPGLGNHWITIKLIGVRSNRSAIGARIRLDIVENNQHRTIYKHVNSGGSFGANPLRQTIGLGKATKIERLEVFWPTSNLTQTFTDVPLDRFLRIEETQDHFTTLDLKPFKLGGSSTTPAR